MCTGKRVIAFLPLALLVHLWTALWMLTNTEIFNNELYSEEATKIANTRGGFAGLLYSKVTGKAGLPLFILFVLLVFLRIVFYFCKKFYEQLYKCLSRYVGIDCGKCFGLWKPPVHVTKLEYWEAIQADSIKGV